MVNGSYRFAIYILQAVGYIFRDKSGSKFEIKPTSQVFLPFHRLYDEHINGFILYISADRGEIFSWS